MPEFSSFERNIISIFKNTKSFAWDGNEYLIVTVGKPRPSIGECKTDAYVLATDNKGTTIELKISIKKDNAEFLENKTTEARAEAIFGKNWKAIIQKSTKSVRDEFRKRPLIFKSKFGNTQKGSITLGWKFEIMYHPGGELSGELSLTPEEIREVFVGDNLSQDKKDAFVNGKQILNSGVPNFILFENKKELRTTTDVFSAIIPMDEFLRTQTKLYFACKALNYRSLHIPKPKWDGNRPLAVYVDWTISKKKLLAQLVFNSPLSIKGNAVAEKLRKSLNKLGVHNTNRLSEQNVSNPDIIHT
jgi:hypothetical protein